MTHRAITNTDQDRQLLVGATADQFARSGVFADYQARRARNTLRRQRDDLATFADYLAAGQFYASTSDEAQRLYSDPTAWSGIDPHGSGDARLRRTARISRSIPVLSHWPELWPSRGGGDRTQEVYL